VQRSAPQLSLFPDDSFPATQKPGEMPGFAVRESGRAKRLSIKVYPRGRVEVVVPKRTRPSDVQSFVHDNREWIEKARVELAGEILDEPFALPEAINLPAIERNFSVRYIAERGARTVRWRVKGNEITLSGRTGDAKHCVDALRRWLAALAKAEFAPQLAALSALTGIGYKRMQVRAQRTCWGSHSCSGTVSLNMCLLFLDPSILHYLMIHELCHGRHMNHSRRFWNLVGSFAPEYRRLDRELGESWRAVPVWMGVC
jgi:predicted metal-dependent hydrolase